MLLLALDTSSPLTSVCLLEDGVIRGELSVRAPTPQSAQHLAVIDSLLKQCGVSLTEVGAFGVTIGPGSFTGLRVGASLIKGFTADEARPLYAVSTLRALARSAGPAGFIVPCIDAKKKEVYAAVFQGETAVVPEGAYAPESFAAAVLEVLDRPSVWIGDGALLYHSVFDASGRTFADPTFNHVRPAAVAALAWEAHVRGDRPADAHLVANYLRASEAERNQGSKKKV